MTKMCFKKRLLIAGISVFLVVLLINFDIVEFINFCRINLSPRIIFLDPWRQPTVPVTTKVYLFNYTNIDKFMSGQDENLHVQEIGPIIYQKYLKQENVLFNVDSTMSYTTTFHLEYPEQLNIPGILNKTIIVPNIILFTMATLANGNFLMKLPMNIVLNKESLFVNQTIYNYLWNFTSPTLEQLKSIVPSFIIPRTNAGVLYNVSLKNISIIIFMQKLFSN